MTICWRASLQPILTCTAVGAVPPDGLPPDGELSPPAAHHGKSTESARSWDYPEAEDRHALAMFPPLWLRLLSNTRELGSAHSGSFGKQEAARRGSDAWAENGRRPPRSWPPASLGLDARKACNQRLTLSSENEWWMNRSARHRLSFATRHGGAFLASERNSI